MQESNITIIMGNIFCDTHSVSLFGLFVDDLLFIVSPPVLDQLEEKPLKPKVPQSSTKAINPDQVKVVVNDASVVFFFSFIFSRA